MVRTRSHLKLKLSKSFCIIINCDVSKVKYNQITTNHLYYSGGHDNAEFKKVTCYSNELQHSTEICVSDKNLIAYYALIPVIPFFSYDIFVGGFFSFLLLLRSVDSFVTASVYSLPIIFVLVFRVSENQIILFAVHHRYTL